MYNIYKEEDFPAGVFRSEEGRKVFLMNAFFSVFKERNGVALTEERLKEECHGVKNDDESSYKLLPCLAMYHGSLPLVRLYFRGGGYELHTLRPGVSKEDALRIAIFDELEHFSVQEEAGK
jgi:hypothetical protein